MRWSNLFDDLSGQLEHELTAEELDLRGEEERLRIARLSLRDRLIALGAHAGPASEACLRLELADGSPIAVSPQSFGRDWFSGVVTSGSGRSRSVIVPLGAIASVLLEPERIARSIRAHPDAEESRLSARLGLPFVLRDLSRRRVRVELVTSSGVIGGTVDRVGRDHLDIAEHGEDEPRRTRAVRTVRMLAVDQLLLIRL